MPNVAIVVVNHTISVRILFTLACGMWMFVFQKKRKRKKKVNLWPFILFSTVPIHYRGDQETQ